MTYSSPTIAWRGKLADAVHQVQQRRDPQRDVTGRITCPACRASLQFTVQANGLSRGQCTAGCGMRWCQ